MVSIVLLINGQKKLIPLTSDVGSGVPLGTLVAFSDDTPKDGYVQMGTTFDETKYPMLFAMRGSNVLPAMFDHSRLGDVETILDSNSQGSYTINSVDYDGVMFISANQGSAKKFEVYINDERVTRAYDSTSVSWMQTATIEVKKGDKVFIDVDANYPMKITARYYKHPLYIKATSGLAENQQENVLNTLNNNLSYSTEEHATGRKWIDGKMIYELTVTGLSYGGTTKAWTDTGYTFSNCDTFIKGYARRTSEQAVLSEMSFRVNNNNLQYYTGLGWSGSDQVTLEYTKTT